MLMYLECISFHYKIQKVKLGMKPDATNALLFVEKTFGSRSTNDNITSLKQMTSVCPVKFPAFCFSLAICLCGLCIL